LTCPLSLGQVQSFVSWLLADSDDGLLIVFNFAASFYFGCCLLSQEMSFVDRYLPNFKQWLITCLLSALLPLQSLLAEGSHEISYVSLLHSPVCLKHPAPLLSVPFQFLVTIQVYLFIYLFWGVLSLSRGLCWFIPGVAVGMPHDAWCSPVWSPNVSQAGL
jgi:hypothetical protein